MQKETKMGEIKKKSPYHEKFDAFYKSPEWKKLRNQKFCDADGLCEECRKQGKIIPAKEVHHIKDIEHHWELRLNYDNLIALCKDCHDKRHERVSPLQAFLQEWEKIKKEE